jgi:hypothetical protein
MDAWILAEKPFFVSVLTGPIPTLGWKKLFSLKEAWHVLLGSGTGSER